MNPFRPVFLSALLLVLNLAMLSGQKAGLQSITIPELEAHISFLASDELKGRDTGEEGLMIAARYLAGRAKLLGLIPLDEEKDYYQNYIIQSTSYDLERSYISITDSTGSTVEMTEAFYMLPPTRASKTIVEGDVVFAGYGIHAEEHAYNDFEGIDIEDKIVLIMNRAPMDEAGEEFRFGDEKWGSSQSFQYKLRYIASQQPRAILLVLDPKSGVNSMDEVEPRIARYLSQSRDLKKDEGEIPENSEGMKLFMIHRHVADQLLKGTGHTLAELQTRIDRELQPASFHIEGKTMRVQLRLKQEDLIQPNIFGYIEGSDPVLKDEMVIYMAHYDHVGFTEEGDIFNGADDNASGTVALLEIADAFMKEKKRPKRSIGFLWVSAEEVGLFGSEYYTEHPLYDMDKTVAAINLDMVGRSRADEDAEGSSMGTLTIVGGDSVKVIGGLQSQVLMDINNKTLEEMGMTGEYRYNDRNHPERYFYRSDHINFVEKDIPVLFYSTGTHHDYHGPEDTPAHIDYDKFLKMTRFCFKAGFNVANYKGEITVDNPYSSW